jgi:hypothetical protein
VLVVATPCPSFWPPGSETDQPCGTTSHVRHGEALNDWRVTTAVFDKTGTDQDICCKVGQKGFIRSTKRRFCGWRRRSNLVRDTGPPSRTAAERRPSLSQA